MATPLKMIPGPPKNFKQWSFVWICIIQLPKKPPKDYRHQLKTKTNSNMVLMIIYSLSVKNEALRLTSWLIPFLHWTMLFAKSPLITVKLDNWNTNWIISLQRLCKEALHKANQYGWNARKHLHSWGRAVLK